MSIRPADDAIEVEPFWQVQSVFDDEGRGGDFAYTIGLTSRGLPELHMWARPTLGEDPGENWMFSIRDRGSILNELAAKLVRGELEVGSQVTEEYDGGLARVTFRVDPPGDPEELEAYGVPPGALVLPVRWSLHRSPEGRPAPLSQRAESAARRSYDRIVSSLPDPRTSVPGWQLPRDLSFSPDQRYGPLTPLVLARVAQVSTADAETILDWLDRGMAARLYVSLTWPVTRSVALGRPAGRSRAIERLERDLDAVMPWRDPRPERRRVWRGVLHAFASPPKLGMPSREVEELYFACLRTLLVCEVVADVADEELLLMARGPWAGAAAGRELPGPEWVADPEVLKVLRRLLARRSATSLVSIGLAHREARDADPASVGYAELEMRLLTYATVSRAASPQLGELLRGLKIADDPTFVLRLALDPKAHDDLVRWTNCVTAALVHRSRLTAQDVRVLAGAVAHLVPGLERILNSPL